MSEVQISQDVCVIVPALQILYRNLFKLTPF